MVVKLEETACYSMSPGPDRSNLFAVISAAISAWGTKKHEIDEMDTMYVVKFTSFPHSTVNLEKIKLHMADGLVLKRVFDMRVHWPDDTLTSSQGASGGENTAAGAKSGSPNGSTLNNCFKIEFMVAKSAFPAHAFQPKDEAAHKTKRKIRIEQFLDGVEDERNANATQWAVIEKQMYGIVQLALGRKKHLPYTSFDLSKYPTHKWYGLHICNMDTIDYGFMRAISAEASMVNLVADIHARELEVRMDGQFPIVWPAHPLHNLALAEDAESQAQDSDSHYPHRKRVGTLLTKESDLHPSDFVGHGHKRSRL